MQRVGGIVEEEKKEVANAAAASDTAAAELAKVKSSNKALKILAIVLSAFFALLLCGALFMYHKLSGFREFLMPASETLDDASFRAGDDILPGTVPEDFRKFKTPAQASGGSALTVFTNTREYVQAAAKITEEDGIKAANAFEKYADRPIVKDFMAEMKKDPDFARALKEKDANNPLAMIAAVQKTKSIQSLTLKYAMRKDFMPLLMEVMNDPDMKPLLGKMGPLMPGGQMLNSMPGAARSVTQDEAQSKNAAAEVSGEPVRLDMSAMQAPPSLEPKQEEQALPGN